MLYQLSYASLPEARAREHRQDRQHPPGCQDRQCAVNQDSEPTHGTNEKAAEPSELAFTAWLPLPEKARDDREEPQYPPGFVDRAYLVFFVTNYEPLLINVTPTDLRLLSPLSGLALSCGPLGRCGYEPLDRSSLRTA